MKSLAEWMRENGLDQYDAARLFECGQSTVQRLVNGKQYPGAKLTRTIFQATAGAVTPNSFFPDLFAEPMAEAAE